MESQIIHQIPVGVEDSGKRLDVWLAQSLPEFSRSAIKRLIHEGLVLLDGKKVKPSHRLLTGQCVEVFEPPKEPLSLTPIQMDLFILYEDDYLVAVNKPAGMVVHPGAGDARATLVHGLLYHFQDRLAKGSDPVRPGIVHRLDKDTSGVLLVAKDDQTLCKLGHMFMQRQISKTYQALVYGTTSLESGCIDLPIGRHPVNRKKMSSKGRHLREALSYWQVEERLGQLTLLKIRIATGRTHQIRVHMTENGWPLVGDKLYGGNRRASSITPKTLSLYLKKVPRQMLHASSISFKHPVTGKDLLIEAPLPDDMEIVLKTIRNMLYGTLS